MEQRAVAEAFSGHRFDETYEHLDPDVQWIAVGETTFSGRDAVEVACEEAGEAMAELTTERLRWLTVVDDHAVVVDTVTRYLDPEGEASVVASCDVYEFAGGLVTRITSYAVEVPDEPSDG